jgi:hypothetical protein
MDRDTFIITVYCLVDEHYDRLTATCPIRHGGFAPQLSDVEVITMEICGEFFKLPSDTALFAYFQTHYRPFFPTLTDRTLFVRQAANLWQIKAAIQRRLVQISGQDHDPVQSIDTLPLPVCTYTRGGRRDRCLRPDADYGYCDAKKLHYYGLKLGLRITRCGLITHYPLLAARPHDIQHLEALVEGFVGGVVAADKGFIDQYRHAMLSERQALTVVTPTRARMTPTQPYRLRRACARWRKVVETVGSQLTERFAVTRIRVRDLWHFQHRLIRKVLAHTVAVVLNLQMERQPLDFEGLLTV